MDLYEYQARELLDVYGVPVLAAEVATTPGGAEATAARIGGPVAVKAQVMTGGRGKAGGVRLATSPAQAREHAEAILGMDIKGHQVHRVLVSAAAEIAQEYYVSFVLDRTNRTFLTMASAEGGVEIEELARERPQSLVRMPIDPRTGCDPATARRLVTSAGFAPDIVDAATEVVLALWAAFVGEDATSSR